MFAVSVSAWHRPNFCCVTVVMQQLGLLKFPSNRAAHGDTIIVREVAVEGCANVLMVPIEDVKDETKSGSGQLLYLPRLGKLFLFAGE